MLSHTYQTNQHLKSIIMRMLENKNVAGGTTNLEIKI
jgi:hypothetical protein